MTQGILKSPAAHMGGALTLALTLCSSLRASSAMSIRRGRERRNRSRRGRRVKRQYAIHQGLVLRRQGRAITAENAVQDVAEARCF
jgi:hypothetical protein